MSGRARRVGQRVAGFLAGVVLLPLTVVGTVVVAVVQVVREPLSGGGCSCGTGISHTDSASTGEPSFGAG
jgi:hypothetical protein